MLHQNGIMIICYHRVLQNDDFDKTAENISNNTQLHEYQVSTHTLMNNVRYFQKHGVKIISLNEAFDLIKNESL